jgi:exopolyphosphatase/guanosine-5'-triphosphate,3'-diphosphate pyrophosphatase
LIGTSGTVTTLAAIQLDLKRYDRRLIDGVFLNLYDIHNMSKSVLHMTPEERCDHPCIGPGRSDLVLMGTSILEGICDTWPLNKLRVADRGVREGILMDIIQDMNPKSRSHVRPFKNENDKD